MTAASVVNVSPHVRTLPRRKLEVHRTPCSETELERIAEELTSELLSGEELHDKKAQRTKQDIRAGKNVACRSILTVLVARVAAGENLIPVAEFADKLKAFLVSLYPSTRRLDLREIQAMECSIESAMNPVQWAINNGDTSAPMLRKLRRIAVKNRAILDDMIACIDAQLNAQAMGLRDVRYIGGAR